MLKLALVAWLFAMPSAQSKPDFSGRWTKIGSAAEAAEVMAITQDATSLTTQYGGQVWRYTLDGAESRNTVYGPNGASIEQIARAQWDGATLVFLHNGRSAQDGPYTVRIVWSLDGAKLVVAAKQTNLNTGAVIFETTDTYVK